jgi:hypothetical protein
MCYKHEGMPQFTAYFTIVIYDPRWVALAFARIMRYAANGFTVQATVITIINYGCKTFMLQATGVNSGRIQTLDLRIVSPVFYHCATRGLYHKTYYSRN